MPNWAEMDRNHFESMLRRVQKQEHDKWMLDEATSMGLLPAGSTTEALTDEIKIKVVTKFPPKMI
ncbi:MAG TPA: hypothetical protein VLH19_04570 [Patescibacteria group bacterium]|nr:hypothetical protein [Patescibacteria group bacterium]